MEGDPTSEARLSAPIAAGSPRDENAADEWRAYAGVDDGLPVFCPECAEREFGTGGTPD
jgi:hypothetical protein